MMPPRIDAWIARLRESLWLVPSLMTVGAVLLAVLTVWIDQTLVDHRPESWFLFSASSEGARAILSTIAGSIITVTGVVFSVTIVALQLASSQYTPRVPGETRRGGRLIRSLPDRAGISSRWMRTHCSNWLRSTTWSCA